MLLGTFWLGFFFINTCTNMCTVNWQKKRVCKSISEHFRTCKIQELPGAWLILAYIELDLPVLNIQIIDLLDLFS